MLAGRRRRYLLLLLLLAVAVGCGDETVDPTAVVDASQRDGVGLPDARAYLLELQAQGALPNADVNHDGVVDIIDLVIVAQNFGQTVDEPASATLIVSVPAEEASVTEGALITLVFTRDPGEVTVNDAIASGADVTRTFTVTEESNRVAWETEAATLQFTVMPPDTESPVLLDPNDEVAITVPAEELNDQGIILTFDEPIVNTDLSLVDEFFFRSLEWAVTVEGNVVTLVPNADEPVVGGRGYFIGGTVEDASRNRTDVFLVFTPPGGPDEPADAPAFLLAAFPPDGSAVPLGSSVDLVFSADPGVVIVNGATTVGAGSVRSFEVGSAANFISWDGGASATLDYDLRPRDDVPPSLVEPLNQGTVVVPAVALNAVGITLVFDEDVEVDEMTLSIAGLALPWIPTADGNVVQLHPNPNVPVFPGETYTLNGAVLDLGGNSTEVTVTYVVE